MGGGEGNNELIRQLSRNGRSRRNSRREGGGGFNGLVLGHGKRGEKKRRKTKKEMSENAIGFTPRIEDGRNHAAYAGQSPEQRYPREEKKMQTINKVNGNCRWTMNMNPAKYGVVSRQL